MNETPFLATARERMAFFALVAVVAIFGLRAGAPVVQTALEQAAVRMAPPPAVAVGPASTPAVGTIIGWGGGTGSTLGTYYSTDGRPGAGSIQIGTARPNGVLGGVGNAAETK